jgi:hypothetical protein
MAETEYTKGFRAGYKWAEEHIIKLLEEADSACTDWAVALIKKEENEET